MVEAMTAIDNGQHQNDKNSPKLNHSQNNEDLDEIMIVATAMIIMVAGYDTTATTLTFTIYEMAKNPKIQAKLQDEIDLALLNNNGKMPGYQTVQGLEYLDMVVQEILRLYTPVPMISRGVDMDYQIPGHNVKLKAKQEIQVPIIGIHRDPSHYEKPNEFYPEHFKPEAKANRHPYAFLAFGQGNTKHKIQPGSRLVRMSRTTSVALASPMSSLLPLLSYISTPESQSQSSEYQTNNFKALRRRLWHSMYPISFKDPAYGGIFTHSYIYLDKIRFSTRRVR